MLTNLPSTRALFAGEVTYKAAVVCAWATVVNRMKTARSMGDAPWIMTLRLLLQANSPTSTQRYAVAIRQICTAVRTASAVPLYVIERMGVPIVFALPMSQTPTFGP